MKYLSLSIPGFGKIDSPTGLPTGTPVGGLFKEEGGKLVAGTGQNIIWVGVELFLVGAVLLSLYYIIRGGINMMTSGGDKEKFQAGRERVRYAIIGLIVVFLSIFMVNFIGGFFGVNLLSLETLKK